MRPQGHGASGWPLLLPSTVDARFDVTAWNAAVQGKAALGERPPDETLLARYLDLPADDDAPQSTKIYELAVHAWHDVPGSKVRATDFVRSLFQLLAIARRREGRRSAGTGTRPA